MYGVLKTIPYLFPSARISCESPNSKSPKPTHPIQNINSMFGIDEVGLEVWGSTPPKHGLTFRIGSVGLEGVHQHRALSFYSGLINNRGMVHKISMDARNHGSEET